MPIIASFMLLPFTVFFSSDWLVSFEFFAALGTVKCLWVLAPNALVGTCRISEDHVVSTFRVEVAVVVSGWLRSRAGWFNGNTSCIWEIRALNISLWTSYLYRVLSRFTLLTYDTFKYYMAALCRIFSLSFILFSDFIQLKQQQQQLI